MKNVSPLMVISSAFHYYFITFHNLEPLPLDRWKLYALTRSPHVNQCERKFWSQHSSKTKTKFVQFSYHPELLVIVWPMNRYPIISYRLSLHLNLFHLFGMHLIRIHFQWPVLFALFLSLICYCFLLIYFLLECLGILNRKFEKKIKIKSKSNKNETNCINDSVQILLQWTMMLMKLICTGFEF